jgi:hypothetical protein
MRYVGEIIGAVMLAALVLLPSACADKCTGVECGPAPPVLQVAVSDTVRVDTTLYRQRADIAVIDTVDTTLVVTRPVTEGVIVTLQQVSGTDTLAFDTVRTTSSDTFIKTDVAGLPATEFLIRADRNGRHAFYGGLKLQQVEGCCSYPVVGFYRMTLP